MRKMHQFISDINLNQDKRVSKMILFIGFRKSIRNVQFKITIDAFVKSNRKLLEIIGYSSRKMKQLILLSKLTTKFMIY